MILAKTFCWSLWLPLLGFIFTGQLVPGAERQSKGRDLYHQQCARCHGRNGEGVKGKYAEALYGDWSLEKLARVIDKTMPEDDPEKCVGEDAGAVARYMYDAFYSREARVRNHPARVELARLTNRQYLHTVADLLKQFTGPDTSPNAERGLRAVYFKSRNQGREGRIIERVDSQVDFDYGTGSPEPERIKPEEFSMQWRGSVIAEETGNYEFVLKTPNGARLWVNDATEPLIDAWVASGTVIEHKATLRLIGGRAYPLLLDFFKSKDKTASVSLQWKPPHGVQEPIPARNLSPVPTTPTLVITTPFPPDDSSVGYERGVSVSKAWDEAATHAAIEVANHVVKHLNRLSHSKPGDNDRAAKVEAFCQQFVEAAFRRPLTEDQKRLFVNAHFSQTDKVDDAVKRVVLLALKSPRFLYLGLAPPRPDDFEVAARLSFGLWDSLPDPELWKLAARRELRTREQVTQQARRMLGDPRARAKMQYFLHHWLQVNRVENLAKDPALFPDFTPAIIADLRTSLDLFLEDTVWNGPSDYRQLLLADYLFLNRRLAEFYGVKTNVAEGFVKVNFAPGQRSGVLTHPYLLSAFSYPKSTSPIHRGVFLTRNIVGRALRSPPMANVFKEADFSPNMTMREKVAEFTRPAACQTCHYLINPLGFSLEHYDAVGRFRTRENERPINAASDFPTDEGESIRLTGAQDVAAFAATSEQAHYSFIELLFHQVVKQPTLAYGPEVMSQLHQSFVQSQFNIQKLVVDIATLSALHGLEKTTPTRRKST